MKKEVFKLAKVALTEIRCQGTVIGEADIPDIFRTWFVPTDYVWETQEEWSVELLINIDVSGVPRADEVLIRSFLVNKKSGKKSKAGIQRWQLEAVEENLHKLLELSVQGAAETFEYIGGYDDPDWRISHTRLSSARLKLLSTDVQRRTHQRVQSDEHFEKVAEIYNQELSRASAVSGRARMIAEIMGQLNTSRGSAESWVREAKKRKLIIVPISKPARTKKPSTIDKDIPIIQVEPKNSTPGKSVRKAVPTKKKIQTTMKGKK